MRKKSLVLLILIFCLTFSGCEYIMGSSAGKIIPPPVKATSFEGKWEVLKTLTQKSSTYGDAGQWSGDDVQFADDAIVLGGQLWMNPSYRIKRVDAEAYLATKNLTSSDVGDIKTADVITIYAAGSYLGEFMKIDESNIIFFAQNNELLLKKISDTPDSGLSETYKEAGAVNTENGEMFSGVLIGLRAETRSGGYAYRTVWIAASPNQLRSVLTAKNIFFPRMSGFWECVSEDASEGKTPGNILITRNAFLKGPDTPPPPEQKPPEQKPTEQEAAADQTPPEPVLYAIDYIGNDYVSAEYSSGGVSQLGVLPVDSLPSPAKIKVGDLLGENGAVSYENARLAAVIALQKDGISVAPEDQQGENFGLIRDKGHWQLVGRINYQSDGLFDYSDFDMKIIPPTNLVFFDTLALNWNRIKDRVPDALDAFTSPDKNIALVKTKNKIAVYAIGTEQLSENSLGEIELAEGETIVMAEWATAIYVDSWERAFIAYGAHRL